MLDSARFPPFTMTYHRLFFWILLSLTEAQGAHWDYGADGPDTWPVNFPESCAGESQSPIDLTKADATIVDDGPPLKFMNYEMKPASMNLINDGHSAKVTFKVFEPKGNVVPQITQFGYPIFELDSFHFHWGWTSGQKGSEHTIEGVNNKY